MIIYFNPLRPRGRRRRWSNDVTPYLIDFNPLRPRGRRPACKVEILSWVKFQPTPPARTETFSAAAAGDVIFISTHSAREDGDAWSLPYSLSVNDFNPLRPRGRRRLILCFPMYFRPFQPTPPARTETDYADSLDKTKDISTHSAREDGDRKQRYCNYPGYDFNPLRPRGRRLEPVSFKDMCYRFQPTPPARTETVYTSAISNSVIDFNPLRPRGRRPKPPRRWYNIGAFQPTPPARTETAILHKKNNNSSSHFHNQITSYPLKSPPTYPAHIQSRFHCAVFPVRIPP